MCNQACIDFGQRYIRREDVEGKSVLEVGAYDVNGSLRSAVEAFRPALYVGVDITPGKGVDRVCKAEDLVRCFGREKFDMVVATEVLEHIADWKLAVTNFKNVLKPAGIIIITTRSKGFGYHGWPFDFWRYEMSDAENIFSDFVIERIEKDPMMAGIFLKARKPKDFVENELKDYTLYSVEFNRRSTIIAARIYFPIFFIIRLFANEIPEWVKAKEAYKRFKRWKKSWRADKA